MGVKEGIDWVMVDFGMDLAAAIIMFEKPMGIWAILEEESLFPKATDKSFEEKLKASLGKLPVFLKPASKTDKNAHFGVSHHAPTYLQWCAGRYQNLHARFSKPH